MFDSTHDRALAPQVDDGEPLRKAALSCLDTILDTLPYRLDVGTLMPYLVKVTLAYGCALAPSCFLRPEMQNAYVHCGSVNSVVFSLRFFRRILKATAVRSNQRAGVP